MPVRVADELKQTNDLETFPIARASGIWIDRNKGEGDEADWISLQKLYNEGGMSGGTVKIDPNGGLTETDDGLAVGDGLIQRLEAIDAQIAALDDVKKKLQLELEAANADKSALQARLDALNADLAELQSLRDRAAALQAEVDRLKSQPGQMYMWSFAKSSTSAKSPAVSTVPKEQMVNGRVYTFGGYGYEQTYPTTTTIDAYIIGTFDGSIIVNYTIYGLADNKKLAGPLTLTGGKGPIYLGPVPMA